MLTGSSRGVVIAVRAVPRAGRSGIAGERGGALLVKLAAAPVDGAANEELIAVLSSALKIPKRRMSVITGERAREKRVLIEGAALDDLRARVAGIIRGQDPPA